MLSFFEKIITSLVYSTAGAFNSYVVVYVIWGFLISVVGIIFSHTQKKNDYLCNKFAPYVNAIQSNVESKEQRDKLLDSLYSANKYSAVPAIIIGFVSVSLMCVVYSSLLMISGEGRNIPVNFLWINDVCAKVPDMPMILIYSGIGLIMTIIMKIIRKEFSMSQLIIGAIAFAMSVLLMYFVSHWFSALILIYLTTKSIFSAAFSIAYMKLRKPFPELIVPDEIEEAYQSSLNKEQEGEKSEEGE